MKRIIPLSTQLANQIAAGEVIERPSSVVKELLENSLDAGADRIDVVIKDGGTQLIRIVDNGAGIHPDDLKLAVHPHATSKIDTVEDLDSLNTMGFRGEALASIAAISRFQLASRQHSEQQAWALCRDAGDEQYLVQPSSNPPGTCIEVKELFYNTPARRRFLRADKTEFVHIENTVKRFVMGAFHVTLSLSHNDRLLRRYLSVQNPKSEQQRLSDIFGKSFVHCSVNLDFAVGPYHLRGWISEPELHRSSSDAQYFYVNGRIVRDKFLNHAVKEAYGERLPTGRFPSYALYLTMPSTDVDVNVHPMKSEVRFRHARDVHDMVVQGLSASLEQRSSDSKMAQRRVQEEVKRYTKTGLFDSPEENSRSTTVGPKMESSQLNKQQKNWQPSVSEYHFANLKTSPEIADRPPENHAFSRELHGTSKSQRRCSVESTHSIRAEAEISDANSNNIIDFDPNLHWLGAHYFWCLDGEERGILDGSACVVSTLEQSWPKTLAHQSIKPFLIPITYPTKAGRDDKLMPNDAPDTLVHELANWGIKARYDSEAILILAAPKLFKAWTLPIDRLLQLLAEHRWLIEDHLFQKFFRLAVEEGLMKEPNVMQGVVRDCLREATRPLPRNWFRRADTPSLRAWFQSEY